MLALLAVQKVELIEQEGWWTHNSSALLLASAAIIAAALAAFVAIWNQQQQLKHDRSLRNQEHVRDTVDAALVSASEGRNTMDSFIAAVEVIEERHDESSELMEQFREQAKDDRRQTLARIQEMRAAQVRLEARLGKQHQITVHHRQALIAYHQLFIKALPGFEQPREDSVRKEDSEREQLARSCFDAFQEACRHWFEEQEEKSGPPRRWSLRRISRL